MLYFSILMCLSILIFPDIACSGFADCEKLKPQVWCPSGEPSYSPKCMRAEGDRIMPQGAIFPKTGEAWRRFGEVICPVGEPSFSPKCMRTEGDYIMPQRDIFPRTGRAWRRSGETICPLGEPTYSSKCYYRAK